MASFFKDMGETKRARQGAVKINETISPAMAPGDRSHPFHLCLSVFICVTKSCSIAAV
jgi:hypothetical protein